MNDEALDRAKFMCTGRGPLVLFAQTGSRAYGTDHADSDNDFKGVYVAPIQHMLSLLQPPRTIDYNDPDDVVLYELAHFAKLAAAANPTVLEILWSPGVFMTPLGAILHERRSMFLSKKIVQTYGGYAVSQIRKAREGTGGSRGQNHHKRTKFRLHTLRLLRAGQHALATGEVLVRLDADEVDVLRKQAALPDAEFEATAKLAMEVMDYTASESPLPDEPDWDQINRTLVELRMAHLGSTL